MPRQATTYDKGALRWVRVESRVGLGEDQLAITGQFEYLIEDAEGNVTAREGESINDFVPSDALAARFTALFEELALEIATERLAPADGNTVALADGRFVEVSPASARKKGR